MALQSPAQGWRALDLLDPRYRQHGNVCTTTATRSRPPARIREGLMIATGVSATAFAIILFRLLRKQMSRHDIATEASVNLSNTRRVFYRSWSQGLPNIGFYVSGGFGKIVEALATVQQDVFPAMHFESRPSTAT
jgi:hypothetical protein